MPSAATVPKSLVMRWWITSLLALAGCSAAMQSPSYLDHYERAATLCTDVPEGVSPLDELDVADTRPVAAFTGRPRLRRTLGARVLLRGRPGWDAARVERWSACHAARNALLLPEERAPHDPLAVEGVRVEVRTAGSGFELRLTAERERGPELYRRAQALALD